MKDDSILNTPTNTKANNAQDMDAVMWERWKSPIRDSQIHSSGLPSHPRVTAVLEARVLLTREGQGSLKRLRLQQNM